MFLMNIQYFSHEKQKLKTLKYKTTNNQLPFLPTFSAQSLCWQHLPLTSWAHEGQHSGPTWPLPGSWLSPPGYTRGSTVALPGSFLSPPGHMRGSTVAPAWLLPLSPLRHEGQHSGPCLLPYVILSISSSRVQVSPWHTLPLLPAPRFLSSCLLATDVEPWIKRSQPEGVMSLAGSP